MNRNEAISYLRSISDKELVDLLYEAFEGRNLFPEEADWSENKLILCNASREKNEKNGWTDWWIELLAQEDKDEYPDGWSSDAPICQEGRTVGDFRVFGWAKKMICPVTGNKIHGT